MKNIIGESSDSLNCNGLSESDQENLRKIIQAAEKQFRNLKIKMTVDPKSAVDLLGQRLDISTLTDVEKKEIELKELSPGMYCVFIPAGTFEKVYNKGAQAAAFTLSGVINFIMLKNFGSDIKKAYVEENLRHETHHLIWKFAYNEGIITSDEEDNDKRIAFINFQDEIMATLVSETHLHGHLMTILDRLRSLNENELLNELTEYQIEINDLLMTTNKLLRETGDSQLIAFNPVAKAKNFHQLRQNLEMLNAYLKEKIPAKKISTENTLVHPNNWTY